MFTVLLCRILYDQNKNEMFCCKLIVKFIFDYIWKACYKVAISLYKFEFNHKTQIHFSYITKPYSEGIC